MYVYVGKEMALKGKRGGEQERQAPVADGGVRDSHILLQQLAEIRAGLHRKQEELEALAPAALGAPSTAAGNN